MKSSMTSAVLASLIIFFLSSFSISAVSAESESAPPAATGLHLADSDASDAADDPYDDDSLDFLDEEAEQKTVEVADPLYYWNYAWYHFNDKFYFHLLKPVARTYKSITPEFLRLGIRNFFNNLLFPVRLTGCLLQGKLKRAGQETVKFVSNTVAGIGGIFNPAGTEPSLNPPPEDIRQALGKWGIGNGFYIVWPLLGPSTLRDSVGLVGEFFLDPMRWALSDAELWETVAVRSLETVNATSFRIGDYEALKDAALDHYAAIRNAYLSNMQKKVEE
jgi:phospholipid-binding lipoprotein MlaA